MKKGTSITIILILAVIGVVVYLLRNYLKTFLGARVEPVKPEQPVEALTGLRERISTRTVEALTGFKERITARTYALAGGVIQGDIVDFVVKLYPAPPVHLSIITALVKSLGLQVPVEEKPYIYQPQWRGNEKPYIYQPQWRG